MPTPHPVDAVLLDAGGVLVLPDHEVVAGELAAVGCPVDPGALDSAHYHGAAALTVWPDTDGGTHRDAAIYRAFNRAYAAALGVEEHLEDRALDALGRVFSKLDVWTRPVPGAADGLRALASTGAKLAVVSNADGQIARILAELDLCQQGPGSAVSVDAIIDSHVVGVAKPDPRIFHLALDALGTPPERAVHIGDIVGADVEGARRAGVTPLHFDPHGLCRHDDHEHITSLIDAAEVVRERRGSRRS